MRVVSLLPSATELLDAVGAISLLVGKSHECDAPASIAHLPILTRQRIDPNSSSSTIDAEVSKALAAGESLYTLDEQTLAELRPDVILTQDLCEVCSIDLAAVARVASKLSTNPTIISLNPHTVEDVIDDLLRVGEAVGVRERAMHVAVTMRERLYAAQEYVSSLEEGPVVLFLEWTDPPFCAGHWTVQLIERAGGRHPFNPTVAPSGLGAAAGFQQGARKAGKSTRLDLAAILAAQPEAIVIAPCGFDLDRAIACTRELQTQPWWRELPAVRSGRVAIVDGNQMFNRPGPRLVEAFEFLVGFLQQRDELIPRGFPYATRDAAGTITRLA